MTLLFLDTSALLKLCLPEVGSAWLRAFVAGNQIVISELALFESASALRRRYLEGAYTRDEANNLYAQIYQDRFNFDIIPLGGELLLNEVLALSFGLPAPLRLRALDAIQLAAATLALQDANNEVPPVPLVFVSSDGQLLNVAQAQGFVIENPETHS